MSKKTLILSLVLLTTPAFAKNNTPDFYRCTGRVNGEWNFGRGPHGCDASAFGDDNFINRTYSKVVFVDAKPNRVAERERYMDELHAVIRDAAEYYIRKRKPNVSQAEVDAWKIAMLTTANQESFWSHYRNTGKLKMMRGDVGHGHGLMQVDDRYHYPAVLNGTAWNILGNITYSMDELYTGWERAPKMSCVKSATNFEARTRSAWAAYNGGPSNICRWTNPKDKWANNDKGFISKLKNKNWVALVKNPRKPASINVSCLIEKRENCAPVSEPAGNLKEGILYRTENGLPCVWANNTLSCMQEYRDALCLQTKSRFTNEEPELLSNAQISNLQKVFVDRHAACTAFDPTLAKVGTMIEAKQDINLRATPGGGLLGTMMRREVAEVLDFEIRNLGENDRYYKVKIGETTGYVYAGKRADYNQWIDLSILTSPLPTTIARPGETLKIVNAAGINQRETAGGNLIMNIPNGTMLTVIDYVIQGKNNDLFYQVNYQNKIGFIYSGVLNPDTTNLWTVREK